MDEPLASCVMVQIKIYVSKRKLVGKFDKGGVIFYWCLVFYCLYTFPKYYLYRSSHMVSLWNSFYIRSTSFTLDVIGTLFYWSYGIWCHTTVSPLPPRKCSCSLWLETNFPLTPQTITYTKNHSNNRDQPIRKRQRGPDMTHAFCVIGSWVVKSRLWLRDQTTGSPNTDIASLQHQLDQQIISIIIW